MQITVALKKNEGAYEAALIIDNKFTRSAVGVSVNDLFIKLAGPLLVLPREDGSEIAINVGILSKAEVDRMERKSARERARVWVENETAEANSAAEELESLVKAQDREAAAKMYLDAGPGWPDLTREDKPDVA